MQPTLPSVSILWSVPIPLCMRGTVLYRLRLKLFRIIAIFARQLMMNDCVHIFYLLTNVLLTHRLMTGHRRGGGKLGDLTPSALRRPFLQPHTTQSMFPMHFINRMPIFLSHRSRWRHGDRPMKRRHLASTLHFRSTERRSSVCYRHRLVRATRIRPSPSWV